MVDDISKKVIKGLRHEPVKGTIKDRNVICE